MREDMDKMLTQVTDRKHRGMMHQLAAKTSNNSITNHLHSPQHKQVRDYVFKTDEALKEAQRTPVSRDGAGQMETAALRDIRYAHAAAAVACGSLNAEGGWLILSHACLCLHVSSVMHVQG